MNVQFQSREMRKIGVSSSDSNVFVSYESCAIQFCLSVIPNPIKNLNDNNLSEQVFDIFIVHKS